MFWKVSLRISMSMQWPLKKMYFLRGAVVLLFVIFVIFF